MLTYLVLVAGWVHELLCRFPDQIAAIPDHLEVSVAQDKGQGCGFHVLAVNLSREDIVLIGHFVCHDRFLLMKV